MEGHLLMSEKERKRKSVLDRVMEGEVTLVEASELLRLSYRQCRRLYKRFGEQGDAGLIHRSRGRPSNRGKPAAFRQAVLERYQQRYEGFGPTLASEKLGEDGYAVNRETLRQWLVAQGLWTNKRKRSRHRSRREPRAHFGELVQMDGSHHRWFGPLHPQRCLMDMVDDATGTTLAHMASEETTEAAMVTLWRWVERYGIPRALYTDRKNVFVTDRQPTVEEQLAGQEPKTAFGKACEKLGIEIIPANSPQAKGRVERKHGVYQDRFVKELQLREINTIEGADALLRNGFIRSLNEKFARPPRREADFHRPVPKGMDLREVFCLEQTRAVANDWTVQYQNRLFQIHKNNKPLPRPRAKVVVRTRLDATMQLVYRGHKLQFEEIEPRTGVALRARSKSPRSGKKQTPPAAKTRKKYKPPPDHPWRRPWT